MEDFMNTWKVLPNYNIDNIQEDFHRCKGQHYLDHAGATLFSDSQIKNVLAELQGSLFGNPHSRHMPSDTATQIIEVTRQRILEHFNTTSQDYDVIFTSGATAALKIVAENFNWNNSSKFPSRDEYNTNVQRIGAGRLKGAFVYQQENHTSVLGIRNCASHQGAEVHSLSGWKLRDVLGDSEQHSSNALTNGKCISYSLNPPNNGTDIPSMTQGSEESFSSSHCLFAYSPQCNFSGVKAPLNWIELVQNGALDQVLRPSPITRDNEDDAKWFVLLDAASLVATCPLDLSKWKPDFVPISFYKIMGYPTGVGCLLVSSRASQTLVKTYHGGGTVLMTDSRKMNFVPRPLIHERFEDGTLPFLNIIALRHGFDVLLNHTGGMENIQNHVYNLAHYTHNCLRSYRHGNGNPVAVFYTKDGPWSVKTHGSIINFNLLHSDGTHVGYAQIEKMSALYNVYLRTGCLCNPGACQSYLNISEEMLEKQFEAGHVCGDSNDLVDGLPTGSVRVSFGYMSTYKDADQFLHMVSECFVVGTLQFDTTWLSEGIKSSNAERPLNKICKESKVSTSYEESSSVNSVDSKSISNNNVTNSKSEIDVDDKLISSKQNEDSRLDANKESNLILKDIIVYPVKSCGGVSVKKWKIVAEGLEYDRKWMVVNDSGVTMTLKRLQRMCLIHTEFDLDNNKLILSYEGGGQCSIPLDIPDIPENVQDLSFCGGRVCGDRVTGLDCGPEIGNWLSDVLDKPNLKLMRQINTREKKKEINGQVTEKLSLANDSQYHLLHLASVHNLLNDIRENGLMEIEEDELLKRFRGNFIIEGGNPYEEDRWKSITIDSLKFKVQGGCPRCQMIGVVSENGDRVNEPMVTLGKKRGSSMMFGIYAKLQKNSDDNNLNNVETTVSVGFAVKAFS